MRELKMIKVYEIKLNGFLGAVKEIEPSEGVSANWTYLPPPTEGCYRWEAGDWIPGVEPAINEPAISDGQLSIDVRKERNTRLAATDWTQGRDVPETTSNKWTEYRQALRDVTEQSGFPFYVEWPNEDMIK